MLDKYKSYLNGETNLEKMCLKGIDFFTRYYKIKFILSDYDPAVNSITCAEINYILAHESSLKDKVIFYEKNELGWSEVSYTDVRALQKATH